LIFFKRCYYKEKDSISREFQKINKEKGSNISLSDDILEIWIQNTKSKSVISELRGAIKYRHWLAHGRFWVLKIGQKYDYNSILFIAKKLQMALEIDMGA